MRSLTNTGDLEAFSRFVPLCAGRTAQLLNLSALAAVLEARGNVASPVVIGGHAGQRRSDVTVVPWHTLHRHTAGLVGGARATR